MNSRLLPDYVAPPYVPPREVLSRPTARQINAATEARETSLTLPGFDEVIPFTFGEDRISGLWLVRPYTHIASGHLRFAILWGEGPALGPQEIYINGEPVPGSVVMTHYTGEDDQPVDPTLQADVAGFADRYQHLSYTVFSVPPGTIDGFPQTARIECVFRGLLTWDDRTQTHYWNENPGLAIGEWLRSTRFGPGVPVYGVDDVADRCDSIVAGVEPRCRMGMTFMNPISLEAMMNLLCAYAECFWTFSDDGVLVVPDAPVDEEDIYVVDRDDIVDGSLQLRGEDLTSSPTQMTVTYRIDTGTKEQWRDSSITQNLPGVEDGEVQAIKSDVSMPGLRRASECYRKNIFRLRRLQRPGRFRFQLFDSGIKLKKGMVARLPNVKGLYDDLVRVLSDEMISHGIYQFTGEKYDPMMYPDEAPNSDVNVPVGFIAWGNAIDTPFGWNRFTAADGLNLRGCAPGDEGQIAGSNAISHSGVSSSNGAHSGEQNMFLVKGSIFQSPAETPSSSSQEPSHNHSYSLSTTISGAYRRQRAFIKVDDPGALPSGVMVLARSALLDSSFQAVLTHVGRLLGNAENPSQGGSSSSTAVLTTSLEPNHTHLGNYRRADGDVGFGVPLASPISAGSHSHSNSSVTVSASIRRRRLMLFQNNVNDRGVIPGIIGGYLGDVGDLLPGWYVCDGNNGTLNLVDYFIEISDETGSGSAIGNGTYGFSGNLRSDGAHNHSTGTTPQGVQADQFGHANTVPNHNHSVSGSGNHTPRHYKMVFIEYTGVE